MCGIAGALGVTARAPEREAIARAVEAIRHRGPDETGIYRDARCALGHARLSIIDLATGQQPLCNEDGTIWVVFNGEIFNYVELREELEQTHRFHTKSDTEVIVHAYEEWGVDAFARFNGQFAVALWDSQRERLVLARDRLGVRPLHIAEHGGRVWFASEVKAIFAGEPAMRRAFDPAGLAETFTFWTAIAPRTPFAGVTELEPGHVRIYERGGVLDRAFWSPRYAEEFSGNVEDAADAVVAALRKATALRMLRADVPVGSYLSGGLDSSLIASLGLAAKGSRFQTFSLRFEDAEYDETRFQREMSERLGTEHHEVVVSRRDIAEVFPRVVLHAERPILRTAPAPLFLLSELVRKSGIKVVLTGEGADEMFAGYDLFREAKVRRFWARQPSSRLRPLLLQRLYPYLQRSPVAQRAVAQQFFGRDLQQASQPGFGHQPRWTSAQALLRLALPHVRAHDPARELLGKLPAEFAQWGALQQDQYLEVRTLLQGYLLSSQGDRMLMAHSVEGRFPFLDAEVVELANSLPAAFKLRLLDEKHVLKRAARGLVPETILARKKQPYRAPDALSLAAAPWLGDVVNERAVRDAGVFDPLAVAQLVKKCRARLGEGQFSNADNMALTGVLSTQLLYEQVLR